jgi:hypothetical protein
MCVYYPRHNPFNVLIKLFKGTLDFTNCESPACCIMGSTTTTDTSSNSGLVSYSSRLSKVALKTNQNQTALRHPQKWCQYTQPPILPAALRTCSPPWPAHNPDQSRTRFSLLAAYCLWTLVSFLQLGYWNSGLRCDRSAAHKVSYLSKSCVLLLVTYCCDISVVGVCV